MSVTGMPVGTDEAFACVKFLPSPSTILVSSGDSEQGTRLIDFVSGAELRRYTQSTNRSRSVALTSDGKTFAVFAPPHVQLFHTDRPNWFRVLQTGWCSDILSTPDGRHLLTAETNRLRVWSVGTGSTVHELAAETARFNEIAISPDGRFMISGGGGTWSEEDKKTVGDGDYAIYVWRLPKSVWPQVAPTDATTPN